MAGKGGSRAQRLARLEAQLESISTAFGALEARLEAAEKRLEEARARPKVQENKQEVKPRRGPLFVEAAINGRPTKAVIANGATHNVLSVKEAARLGLPISPCDGWIRGPCTDWEPLSGAARKVSLRVGSWQCVVDFMIFPMDAVDTILGRDFLEHADVDVHSARNGIWIKGGERPEFVAAMANDQVDRSLILTLEIRLRGEEDHSTKP